MGLVFIFLVACRSVGFTFSIQRQNRFMEKKRQRIRTFSLMCKAQSVGQRQRSLLGLFTGLYLANVLESDLTEIVIQKTISSKMFICLFGTANDREDRINTCGHAHNTTITHL